MKEKYFIIHSSYEFLASIHIINPAHNEGDNKFQVKFLCVEKWCCCEWNAEKKYYIAKRKKNLSMCVYGWIRYAMHMKKCVFSFRFFFQLNESCDLFSTHRFLLHFRLLRFSMELFSSFSRLFNVHTFKT